MRNITINQSALKVFRYIGGNSLKHVEQCEAGEGGNLLWKSGGSLGFIIVCLFRVVFEERVMLL